MASTTGHPDAVPTPDADGAEGRAAGKQPRAQTEGRFKGPAGRIEDYAIIGNCRTTALVGRDGSIDWLCLPRFDSDAVFARLLGDTENGHWQIAPEDRTAIRTRRHYRDNTLVLETEFETEGGTVALIDFMPFPHREDEISIVRLVEGRAGRVPMRMEAAFRFDYGRIVPWVRHRPDGIVAIAGPDALRFRSPIPLHGEIDEDGRRLHGRGRRPAALHPDLVSVASAGAGRHRPVPVADRHRDLVAWLGPSLHL